MAGDIVPAQTTDPGRDLDTVYYWALQWVLPTCKTLKLRVILDGSTRSESKWRIAVCVSEEKDLCRECTTKSAPQLIAAGGKLLWKPKWLP